MARASSSVVRGGAAARCALAGAPNPSHAPAAMAIAPRERRPARPPARPRRRRSRAGAPDATAEQQAAGLQEQHGENNAEVVFWPRLFHGVPLFEPLGEYADPD